jgi:hypothetical protein
MTATPIENLSKNQKIYRRLMLVAIMLGLPVLFFYGYCWGLWGRSSLLLQYLFQCNCPIASEEWRYPKRVDVIVSACEYIGSRLSPSGRLLLISEKANGGSTIYLLDLQSMERAHLSNQTYPIFLTDDLWFLESGLEDTIIDRATGRQYPIQSFENWRENAYINGEPNIELLVAALWQAEYVFFDQMHNDTVIVLMFDFLTNPSDSFTFDRVHIPTGDFNNKVEQFLQVNNIIYQTIPEDFMEEAISPDGKLVARTDGIYIIETGQKIVNSYSIGGLFHPFSGKYLEVRGWSYDGTGVIYSKFRNPCLIEMVMFGSLACFYEVTQPLIILKMPEEYFTSTQTP